jgi:hypothetical protein
VFLLVIVTFSPIVLWLSRGIIHQLRTAASSLNVANAIYDESPAHGLTRPAAIDFPAIQERPDAIRDPDERLPRRGSARVVQTIVVMIALSALALK